MFCAVVDAGEAVNLAEEFAGEVTARVKEVEKRNQKEMHAECNKEVKEVIHGEREELGGYGKQCAADLVVLGM